MYDGPLRRNNCRRNNKIVVVVVIVVLVVVVTNNPRSTSFISAFTRPNNAIMTMPGAVRARVAARRVARAINITFSRTSYARASKYFVVGAPRFVRHEYSTTIRHESGFSENPKFTVNLDF